MTGKSILMSVNSFNPTGRRRSHNDISHLLHRLIHSIRTDTTVCGNCSCRMSADCSVLSKHMLTDRTLGRRARVRLTSAALYSASDDSNVIAASLCTCVRTCTGVPMKRQRERRAGSVGAEDEPLLLLLNCAIVVVPVVSTLVTSAAIDRPAIDSDNCCLIGYVRSSVIAALHV